MRALLLLPVLLAADGSAFEVTPSLQTFLDTGKWDATPKSFRIIALSNLADGCAHQAMDHPELIVSGRACVEQTLARAKELKPTKDSLFLTHLALIYGAADQLGPCPDETEHRRISELLAKRSLADPLAHAASYERLSYRWPADQSATLAALGRFDRAHATHLLDAPLAAWTKVMNAHLDAKTGLPWSEVTGTAPGAKIPRGCAQSFLTRYLAEVDSMLAATWWKSYREHFFVRLGPVVGFREWPEGRDRAADVDSGPIVMGIGTAASAFAISAAKVEGDTALATQLESGAEAVRAMGVGGKAAQSLLATSIAFEARWH